MKSPNFHKIYAGKRMADIYSFASKHNITVVGGADQNVGIGGWISGWPLSSQFEIWTWRHQVLKMEVVTADGEFRTINADTEADLFWALRGTTADSDAFWNMNTYFHSQLPHLSETGLMRYYYAYPSFPGEINSSHSGKIIALLLVPEKSPAQVQQIMDPIERHLLTAQMGRCGSYQPDNQELSRFHRVLARNPSPPNSRNIRTTRRSPPGQNGLNERFRSPQNRVEKTSPSPGLMIGHLIAGPGVHSPPGGIAGGSNVVLPAWREACSHLGTYILPAAWPALDKTAKENITKDLPDVRMQGLRDLTPNGGAYMNEVDPTEAQWQYTLFGRNYARLLEIKKKWDPNGVFWCYHCVGSELWTFVGDDDAEAGYRRGYW
ncbi:Hypothetical protein R9X50_00393900 [Acrodontium crateriforme]|uniref:Berberine/berberine-like domain-containing protein n=1 Tax=Acrodontium crateriforme TaxID=150365 RepID=A0AAQ3M4D4_9PEZI|nr:Hypothetical protein R9X50_00393900 [Acrodontium crateriforme]